MAKAPKEKSPPPPPAAEEPAPKKSGPEEAPPPKKGGRLKLILVFVAAMVVSGGAAFFATITIMGGGETPAPAAESPPPPADGAAEDQAPVAPQRSSGGHGGDGEAPPAEGEGVPVEASGPVNVEFKPFIVNLSDPGGRRMLKLSLSVEAETQELADEVNAKMPLFRDTILLLLSSVQSDDVSSLDGKQRLKNQMLNRINPNLTKGKIKNLYFSEMVVQ